MTGKSKLWWTLEEYEEEERVIGDPEPTFQVISEEEDEEDDGFILLGPDGTELLRPSKTLGFLVFGEE